MSNSKDCKEVFTDIYARKIWGDGSGGGSGEQAQPYCDFVSRYMVTHGTKAVLDIGCGDLLVAKNIQMCETYFGIDAAPNPNGEQNRVRLRYRGAGTPGVPEPEVGVAEYNFDVLTDELPGQADLVLCKEVLQHLSNEQVQTLLDRTAHYPRRLFTNNCDPEHMNEDIETGGFRPVDLSKPPFNQPCKTVFTYGRWHIQEL